ncbi:AtpZ/AtpI family protein [Asticcacaulis sp. AC402]|uniref:AtpZ/AtpI family protein n=1 Tax=Asticcacaulis sp. AC402 TaxID=1282361 RepID=UPI001F2E64AB|nr:AtpZ/AtpI family protein [Asticcacaulis sp. AC402]
MTDEPPNGSSPDDELKDLDDRLKAAEARQRKTVDHGAEVGANQGYLALGELMGGIGGGLGLGWLVDTYLLGSTPWGMIAGAILGMVVAVYLIVKRGQAES